MTFKSVNVKLLMTDADFVRICEWVKGYTGIKLSDTKRPMVISRLGRRLRNLGFESFKKYLDYVEAEDGEELVHFKNAITTNLTAFFREPHHFEFLKDTVVPDIRDGHAGYNRKDICIWSAGCSTGEEAYSIAITLAKALPNLLGWDIRILATDIDTAVLQHGKDAIYDISRIEKVDEKLVKGAFRKQKEDKSLVRVADHIRNMVVFNHLNLMSANWPMKSKFDVIFCRNVMIYFDKETQNILVNRFCDLLNESGYLIVGHSETLFGLTEKLRLVGKNVYQLNA